MGFLKIQFKTLAFLGLFSLFLFIPGTKLAGQEQPEVIFVEDFENWTTRETTWGIGETPFSWEPWAIFSSAVSNPTISDFIAKTANAHSGNFAYELGANSSVGGYTRTVDAIEVKPGSTLELTFYAKGWHTDEPFRARVYFNLFDANDVFLGNIFVAIPNYLLQYTSLSGQFIVPCTGEYGRLNFDKADFGTVTIDDLQISVVAETECPDDEGDDLSELYDEDIPHKED